MIRIGRTYAKKVIAHTIPQTSIQIYILENGYKQLTKYNINSNKFFKFGDHKKYGYESQSAFTRAFKEMHGQKPLSARQMGISPFWYVGAYFLNRDDDKACVIGAELKDEIIPAGMSVEIISATAWVVFPFVFRHGEDAAGETYARALTEWLPTSNYSRNVSVPYLEVYGHGADKFEVWVPIV